MKYTVKSRNKSNPRPRRAGRRLEHFQSKKAERAINETFIYLDHAATTPLKPEVLAAMQPYLTGLFGNASSVYFLGRESKKAIESARDKTAAAINCTPGEIIFTSGGTESDNWAIRGTAYANRSKGRHIITSAIEHHAVLDTCQQLEKEGFEVTYLPVDEFGAIDPDCLEKAIRPDTILISIMYANNEVGTVQPIDAFGSIAKQRGIIFHTDAVQAVGALPIDVRASNIDLLSLSAHKFYGPKGVGALYIKRGTKIQNLLAGGSQEKRKRPGTENVAGIVGLGHAIELAMSELTDSGVHLTLLRDKTIDHILEAVPYSRLNGHPSKRLPGNVNFSFDYVEGESVLLLLDRKGIAASSGSACASGSLEPSHVLLAMGLGHETAHGSLRLSFGSENTLDEVNTLLAELPEIVAHLRTMSPLYQFAQKQEPRIK